MNKVITTLYENMWTTRLKGLSSQTVKDAFFANFIGSLLLLRMQDLDGLALAKRKNDVGMTDIELWSKAMLKPDASIKQALQHGEGEKLEAAAKQVNSEKVGQLLGMLNKSPDQVDWELTSAILLLLRQRFEVCSALLNKLICGVHCWSEQTESKKRSMLINTYIYLLQSDPNSMILERICQLTTQATLAGTKNAPYRLKGFKRLAEDEGGGTSTANIASGDNATGNAIISRQASVAGNDEMLSGSKGMKGKSPIQVGNTRDNGVPKFLQKLIKKRKKVFKAIKFRVPAHLKVNKEESK